MYKIKGYGEDLNKRITVLTAICTLGASFSVIETVHRTNPDAAYDALCQCVTLKFSFPVIKFLVEATPGVLGQVDEEGWNALHHTAVCKDAPEELINYLASHRSSSLQCQTKSGSTPLHLACANQTCLEKLRFFIDKDIKVLSMKDDNGQTPLHVACSHSTSLEVIEFLVIAFPDALEMRDVYGYVPLHAACERSNASLEIVRYLVGRNQMTLTSKGSISINASMDVVELHVAEAPVLNAKTNAADRGGFGRTPLHLASEEKGRADIVKFLAEKNPACLTEPDGAGDLPIHRACWYSDKETVAVLHDLSPETLNTKNGEQLTPFLKACMIENIPVVTYMAENYPALLQEKDNEDSWCALHFACAHRKKNVIKVLLHKYPNAAKEIDNKGRTPLALVAGQDRNDMEVIEWLVDVYPDAMKSADLSGNRPALSHDQMYALIAFMAKKKSSKSDLSREDLPQAVE
jgi:ankyrin repeat protein